MKVKITHSGHYSSFPYKGKHSNHQGPRQLLSAGDEADFPQWYALGLVESELAEEVPFQMEQAIPQASKAAEELARDHRVDLGDIQGSGPGGKITVNDVRAAVAPVE